ncbi:MAG: IS5 family transposase [bacterium]|nr:IS5 family transposase [bacterium]
MEITQEQYQLIADTFPKPRGNVKVSNRQALNGILHILEHGCKWRALPERYGNWHTVYMRFSRWAHNGVLTQVFQRLQQEQLIDPDVLGLDSTTVKVHPDGCSALRKRGPQAIGRSRGGLTTKSTWSPPTPAQPSSTLLPQAKTTTDPTDANSSKASDRQRRNQ